MTRWSSCRGQLFVQLVDQWSELSAEELVGGRDPALLGEGREVVVLSRIEAHAGCDLVADHLEPPQLVGREAASVGLLLAQPEVEAQLDHLGVGNELVILLQGVADEADQIRVELAAMALDAVLLEPLIGAPDTLGRQVERGLADRRGELLDLGEVRAPAVGL